MPDYLFTYLLNKTIKSRNLNAADDLLSCFDFLNQGVLND